MGLRPFDCWDCGFESRRGHGCLSFLSVVRRDNHSSKGVVPSRMCSGVIEEPRRGGRGQIGLTSHEKKPISFYYFNIQFSVIQPSTLRSSKLSYSFTFPYQTLYAFVFSPLHPSYLLALITPIMKLWNNLNHSCIQVSVQKKIPSNKTLIKK